MDTKVRIVIQARMGSSRLVGKVMAPLGAEPLLAHAARRLLQAAHGNLPWEVWVATTTLDEDDAVVALCDSLGVRCFRGPAQDVLARYVLATADLRDDDVVVRATGDNPLYCPRRAQMIVDEHVRAEADYTCIENLSYVVPEVIKAGALRAMADRASDAASREHVTPYFRQHGDEFRTHTLPSRWAGLRPEIRLTIDTPAELERMRCLFDRLGESHEPASLERVYDVWDRNGFPDSAQGIPSGEDHGGDAALFRQSRHLPRATWK